MKSQFGFVLLLSASGFCGFFSAGCGGGSAPSALPVEKVPIELRRAFKQSAPDISNVVSQVAVALDGKDYPAAYEGVYFLCNLPQATKDQRRTASQSMLTVNNLLQTARAQGDQKAAAAVQFIHQNH